jgi:Mg2+-importing ATPase
MLPMIVSANLAKGAVAMARRKVVVKRLNAIQNFGSMDVLCTDKTGTLTQDRIILEHHVASTASATSTSSSWPGSTAITRAASEPDGPGRAAFAGRTAVPAPYAYAKVDELPFDFIRRRLSVVVKDAPAITCWSAKGAVEEMLAIATHVQEGDSVVALDPRRRQQLLASADAFNQDGFRVLVVATREIPAAEGKAQYHTAMSAIW